MKRILILLYIVFIISGEVFAQKTYLSDTAFTTDIGYGGAPASCLFKPGGYYLGWQMGRGQGTWLADVFTVPAGSTWTFDTVIVYGYQKGSGITSPFLNCNLQIYKGTPGLGGTVIWGDTSTNVLVSTGFTGIYRVDTAAANGGLLDNLRPIMYLKLYLSPAASLPSGTYWLSWSSAGSLSIAPNSPDKVLPGRINPPGEMARQLFNGKWYYIGDSSHNIGMNMMIKASAALAVPDLNGLPSPILSQNIPNPFNESTKISFYLPQEEYVKLSIYNTMGQLINELIDKKLDQGDHQIIFNANNLPNGIYYYQLKTNTGIKNKQMEVFH